MVVCEDPLSLDDMFQTKEHCTWKEFISEIAATDFNAQLIWRGQGDSTWEIISSYTRDIPATELFEDKSCWKSSLRAYYHDLLRNMPEDTTEERINPFQQFCNSRGIKSSALWALCRTYDEFRNEYHHMFGTDWDITFRADYELSKWAWGQHYNIKTPLIDWTKYALYALFFALEGYRQSSAISVYSLNIDVLKDINQCQFTRCNVNETEESLLEEINCIKKFFGKTNFLEQCCLKQAIDSIEKMRQFITIFSDMRKLKLVLPQNTRNQNLRLHSQGGLFTFVPMGISIEEWCRRFTFAREGQPFQTFGDRHPLITKHNISINGDTEKFSCLTFLENANINAKTVYPDFQGLGNYVNKLAEKRNYRNQLFMDN